MKILLIGATGFIGSHLVKLLDAEGDQLAVYSRNVSQAMLPRSVTRITGSRAELTAHRDEFVRFAPDIIVDLILSSGLQAKALVETFRGLVPRLVILSSADVYRACGVLHGFEPGPLQPVPLTEESQLRTKLQVYPPEALTRLQAVFPWLDDAYDKIPVEQAVMSDAELAGTVLRLPMVYGPGDPLHRLFPYLKRMDDGRRTILIQEDAAMWRGPRGYVENVAAAIELAAHSEEAAHRIYNIAEPEAPTELEWVESIALAAEWDGRILTLPKSEMPAHLQVGNNLAQHWAVSSFKIRNELGYSEPIDEDTALGRTLEWERANPPTTFDEKQFDYSAEDRAIGA